MRVCLSSGIEIDTLTDYLLEKRPETDLVVIGFGACAPIDYIAEIMSVSGVLTNISFLSKELDCVVVIGLDTELYSARYKSAAVFNGGRLLNISDMVDADGSEYSSGTSLNVYKTNSHKIGVVVDSDIFISPAEALYSAGSDVIVSLFDSAYSSGAELALKREAFGRCPLLAVARDFSAAVTPVGEISHEGAGVLLFNIY